MSIDLAGVSELLNQLAEQCVLLDPSDADGVSELVTALDELLACLEEAPATSDLRRAGSMLREGRHAEGLVALGRALDAARDEIDEGRLVSTAAAGREAAERAEPAPAAVEQVPEEDVVSPELLAIFASEADELVVEAERLLLALQDSPDSAAAGQLYRAFHTLKGSAGYLALDELGAFAHEVESLLSAREDGLRRSDLDLVFEAVDVLRGVVEQATRGRVPVLDAAAAPLRARVRAALQAEPEPEFELDEPTSEAARPGNGEAAARGAEAGVVKELVRVDAQELEEMVDLVGELVLAQAILSRCAQQDGVSPAVDQGLKSVGAILRELQTLSSRLRMVPIAGLFQRMRRLGRDLARTERKAFEVVVQGEETRLDKAIIDGLAEPMVHLLRNAVDHGLEASIEERRAAGKPDVGRIELCAFHRGGQIHVEVRDDGRGLDIAQIRRRAVASGLIDAQAEVGDSELLDFVFRYGFSTRDTVTTVSGRGVGLDVVRTAVEAMRGTVEVRSVRGKGTTFALRLPLTLAIIDGLVVRLGNERYVLPALSVVRSLRPRASEITHLAGGGRLLQLGDSTLPLLPLGRLFKVPGAVHDPTRALAVIVELEERDVGLLVDEVLGKQHVLVKSLGDELVRGPGITGGALLPDGHIGLTLDPGTLVRHFSAGEAGLQTAKQDDRVQGSLS